MLLELVHEWRSFINRYCFIFSYALVCTAAAFYAAADGSGYNKFFKQMVFAQQNFREYIKGRLTADYPDAPPDEAAPAAALVRAATACFF
jgi:hypothetical protein